MRPADSGKPRVVLIDDHPDVRKILTMRLRRAGFDVTTAEDGEAGLTALRRGEPTCILLDLKMPRMDGFELLSILRRRGTPHPPVFVMVESMEPSVVRHLYQLGAYRIFPKATVLHPDFADALRARYPASGQPSEAEPAATRASAIAAA